MSDTLKGLLIIASVLTVGWILRKIRKNKKFGKMGTRGKTGEKRFLHSGR